MKSSTALEPSPTAAALTAAVPEVASANSQTMNALDQEGSFPIPEGLEFDLADPKVYRYERDPRIDLFAHLQELHPADPGELSGCTLWIVGGGQSTGINAELPDFQQPRGGKTRHCLGFLDATSIRRLVEEAEDGAAITMGLRELYPVARPGAFSGAQLAFSGGDRPEGRLCIGSHCLGILPGELAARFLCCARIRLGLDE